MSAPALRFIADLEKLADEAVKENAVVMIHPEALRLLTNLARKAHDLLENTEHFPPAQVFTDFGTIKDAIFDMEVAQLDSERMNKRIAP